MYLYGASPLIASFIAFTLAEFGDKTQIATVMLASSSRRVLPVFLGSLLGLIAVNLPFILLGDCLTLFIPVLWVKICSALLFITFGLLTLRKTGGLAEYKREAGFLRSALLVGLMELGDKTNLTALALAATFQNIPQVLAGVCLASAVLVASASYLGVKAVQVLGNNKMRIIRAIVFIAIGIYIILEILA